MLACRACGPSSECRPPSSAPFPTPTPAPRQLLSVFFAFEKCVALREDLSKVERKSHLETATKALREYGEPPGDDDELLAVGGIMDSMQSSSMSRGASWDPSHVSAIIMRTMFPDASVRERANVLFAGWKPHSRSPSPSLRQLEPMAMGIDSFLGGGGAGGAAAVSISGKAWPAPSQRADPAAAKAGHAARASLGYGSDEDGGMGSNSVSKSRGVSRRNRGESEGGDDFSAAAPPSRAAAAAPGNSGVSAFSKSLGKGGGLFGRR